MKHCYEVTFILVLTCLTGCGSKGPEVGLVSGSVTLDGAPVENALIRFIPQADSSVQRPVFAVTDAEGRYEATFNQNTKGVPVGRSNVELSTGEEYGVVWQGEVYNRVELFPREYRSNFETVEIVAGENTFDFHCQTEEGKKVRESTKEQRGAGAH